MVGRSVDKKDEIRAYIKARSKLGCSLKKLMTEISTAFGPSCVSYDTVRQWKKKFESGVESNVVTGDETWVHYFEPVRKVSNKIWATKHSKRPIIAKRSLSTKKVLYAIFVSGEGVAIKVPVKKGKSITGKYYKDVALKKLKKYYQKRRPATGFKHVHLLHDNAPAHTSAIVTAFLKKEKVTVPPPPPRPCPM